MNKIEMVGKKVIAPASAILYKAFRYLLLIGVSYVVLFPIIKMITGAFTLPLEHYMEDSGFLPDDPTFINFQDAYKYFPYFKYMWKTVQVAGICTILQLISCSVVGYGLGRYKFKGNMLVFVCVLFTIILPIQVTVIPAFYNYRWFNLFGIGDVIGWFTGTPVTINLLKKNMALFVPCILGVGLNSGIYIFLFKQYFEGMPRDLEEAARIDGCSPFMTFLRVMIPNIKPVIVTVALLSVIYYWNDTLLTGVYITKDDGWSLMLALEQLQDDHYLVQDQVDHAQLNVQRYAILIMIVTPLMLIFTVCQKFFVECMDRSGSKG